MLGKVLELYGASSSFDEANDRAKALVLPLVPIMDRDAVTQVVAAAGQNGEIKQSFRWKKVVEALRQLGVVPEAEFDALLVEHRLADE